MVECLRCGSQRETITAPLRQAKQECERCAYVGWAPVGALSDQERRALRSRPLEGRRLRLA